MGNITMKIFAILAAAYAVAVNQEEQQDVDLSVAMDQMTPEQMETMLDAADQEIPQDADLGEMPEEVDEDEELEEEPPVEDEDLDEDADTELPEEEEELEEDDNNDDL